MTEQRKLTIVLHSGQRYEMAYEYREKLLDYFKNPQTPLLIFETTDGLSVFLQKSAVAAIEAASGPDRPTVQGFTAIGQDRNKDA
jgi:hypothetical protein